MDRLLALALTLQEDDVCPGCGQPRYRAYNADSEGYYEAVDQVCQGCAELHRGPHGRPEKAPAGTHTGVVDTEPGVRLRPLT